MRDDIRRLFPVTERLVYLNNAAVAPIAIPAYQAMERYIADIRDHGLARWREWVELTRQARQTVARFINADEDEVAFVPNTSTGISFIANGLEWSAGDNIVTSDCEFPSNQYPWQRISREHGVELRAAREREGRVEIGELLSLIDDRTRVLAISYVEYASGFRNDVKTLGEICNEKGILLSVDGIQALGALKVDVKSSGISCLSADGHKFLLGPEGLGILFVSRSWIERIRPTVLGWTSVANPFDFTEREKSFAKGARRFEPGALNIAGIAALKATLELMEEIGQDSIECYLHELTDYLVQALNGLGMRVISSRRQNEWSAIVSCESETVSAEKLYQALDEQGIITTARLGRLRISPHFYNNRADIDQLVAALGRLL